MLTELAHVGKNHWTAVIVKFLEGKIYYGDSFGKEIQDLLQTVLNWWTNLHSKHDFPFSYDKLPITKQKDGVSCGIFTWNALIAHFISNKELLSPGSVMADEQLRVFLQIAHRHQHEVRHFLSDNR